MNGMETRFKIGNKVAEKWTKEEVDNLFEKMYYAAENDDEILCFNDACMSAGYRHSHVDYFLKKFPVLEVSKKDIKAAIVSRINKQALNNNFNATASIWRMKQLGERDSKDIDIKDERRTLDNDAREARIKELKEKLNVTD